MTGSTQKPFSLKDEAKRTQLQLTHVDHKLRANRIAFVGLLGGLVPFSECSLSCYYSRDISKNLVPTGEWKC